MVLALVRLSFALALTATGSIRGKITVQGRDGAPKKDAAEVVVYVADVHKPATGTSAVIGQKGRQFLPRVLAVAAGTQVDFPNDDSIEHNVFSHSASADFDLGRYGKGASKSRLFDKLGVVEVFCNMHKEMVAYVVVTPSKAFAVTAPDGSFTLSGVPAGPHKLAIWDRFARPKLRHVMVEVPVGGEAIVNETVREQLTSEPSHKNKFGVDYNPGYK